MTMEQAPKFEDPEQLGKKIFDSLEKPIDKQFAGGYGYENEEIVRMIKDTLDKDGIDTSELVIEGEWYEENLPENEKNTQGTTEYGIRVEIKKGDKEIFHHDFVTDKSSY